MNWFCVHTKPQKEAQVSSYCNHVLGLETYYPLLRQHRTSKHTRHVIVGPLFHRYIFCRFSLTEFYRGVRYAPDTTDIVQFGGKPAIVGDELISEIKQWAGAALDASEMPQAVHEGSKVQVKDGPLRGVTGIVLHLRDNSDRVEILLTLLMQDARVMLHREQLELAEAS